MIKIIKNFTYNINFKTFIIIFLSLITTYLCLRFDIIIQLPTGLIGIAIVFPIVFSINAAYRRREEALNYLASIKSSSISLFYLHRDLMPGDNREHAERIRLLTLDLFKSLNSYFMAVGDKDTTFRHIYSLFSRISLSIRQLRIDGIPATDITRALQYLRTIITEFECMRNIFIYRTPNSLRAYTQVFLNIFPIIFGPYFAYLSTEFFYSSGYFVSVLYCLVLVCLNNIQNNIENPYDGIGLDDINLNIAEEYAEVLI